jgi:hypothetical protein
MMSPTLENFFLRLPSGTLRKASYAWFGVVVFYPWSPIIAAVLAAILFLCLFLVNMGNRAWEQRELREATRVTKQPYVDHPHLPVTIQARNLAFASLASGLVAYLLGEQLGLTTLQWFLIFFGFFVLQMDVRLFGAGVVYILNNQGLAIRYSDTKVFIRFNEIRSVAQVTGIKRPSPRWSLLTPSQSVREGLLLDPLNREGFTRLLDQIMLTPTDTHSFLKHLPPRIKVEQVSAES